MSQNDLKKVLTDIKAQIEELETHIKVKVETKQIIEKKIEQNRNQIKRYRELLNQTKQELEKQLDQYDHIFSELKELEEKKHQQQLQVQELEEEFNKTQVKTEMVEEEQFFHSLEADLKAAQKKRKSIQEGISDLFTRKSTDNIINPEILQKVEEKIDLPPDSFDPGLEDDVILFQDQTLTPKEQAQISANFTTEPKVREKFEANTLQENNLLLKSKSKPLCIICHSANPPKKSPNNTKLLENWSNELIMCPNGHVAHSDCLKHWIIHSSKCPVCHIDYSKQTIEFFQDYLEKVHKEQEEAEQRKQAQLKLENQPIPDDPRFSSATLLVKDYLKQNDFERAISELWHLKDQKMYPENDPHTLKILFQLGVTYYKWGKYPLAMQQLMKLVRLDFQYPLGFYFLGKVYEKLEMPSKKKWAFERSIRNLTKSVEINPRYEKFLIEVKKTLNEA